MTELKTKSVNRWQQPVTCTICNKTVTRSVLRRHEKTKSHLALLEVQEKLNAAIAKNSRKRPTKKVEKNLQVEVVGEIINIEEQNTDHTPPVDSTGDQ